MHFAEIDGNNIVKRVIVAEQDFIDSGAVGDSSNWIQTSYNTMGGVHYTPNSNEPDGGIALRKNFAGIGFVYDKDRDAFYTQQPYPSWLLNEESYQWESPVSYPDDGSNCIWNEEKQGWDKDAFYASHYIPFYSSQPYPSWLLNEESYQWESPVPYPDDGGNYNWNEENQSWDLEDGV